MDIKELYEIFSEHPEVTTDSRNCPAGALFFALKGSSFNGNLFASQALASGAAYAIVDEADVIPAEGDKRYILVPDVLKTLQALAHCHRKQFHGPVIEITGTNGKTTTKELLTAVLSKKYNVLSTLGNLNNHIGVPKTLLRIKPFFHHIAVVETGANHPGEIAFLANIVDPDCGLITNVGRAHLEGFGSFKGVCQTKGELYDYLRKKNGGFIFLNTDNPYLQEMAQGLVTLNYGEPGNGEKMVEGEVLGCNPFLTLRWRKGHTGTWHITETHLIGAYNLQNALAAACAGIRYGVTENDITEALSAYIPQNDRSELRSTPRNRLVVDAYNANPSSMTEAIKNFSLITGEHKMVILGDMKELVSASEEEHQKIIDMLQQQEDVEMVWLVGENFMQTKSPFRCFTDVEEVKKELAGHPLSGHLILIKGSNGTRLYQLPELL